MNRHLSRRLGATLGLAALSLALSACVGERANDPEPTTSSTSSSTPVASLSGTFTDAPTKGLSYSASPSGLKGSTDANGKFKYQAGDTISFSLPLGDAGSLPLGSYTPAGNGGSAQVFVLALPNGAAIAQVLQSLDRSPSASTTLLDVSGLKLPAANAADITALKAYINGGSADPIVLLTNVRTHLGSTGFHNANPVTLSEALEAAGASLQTLANKTPLKAATVFKGQTLFHLGQDKTDPDAGFLYINSLGNSGHAFNGWTTRDTGGFYHDFFVDIGAGALVNQLVVDYSSSYTFLGTASTGAYLSFNEYGTLGGGSYATLKDLDLDALHNKAITVSGWNTCGAGKPVTLVFFSKSESHLQFWTAYCETASKLKTDSRVAASGGFGGVDVSGHGEYATGLLEMNTGSCNGKMYAGAVGRGLVKGGQIALSIVPQQASRIGTNKLLNITELATVDAEKLIAPPPSECPIEPTTPIKVGSNAAI